MSDPKPRAGLLGLILGDPSADSTVPPGGVAGRLTMLASAAAALLAVVAIAATLAATRAADRWSLTLGGAATLELPPAADALALDRAEQILGQTPGIGRVRRIGPSETRALLAPWLGDAATIAGIELPVLLAVEETGALDTDSLDARLQGELPEAIYHRHQGWRDNLTGAADRLRWLAAGGLILILGLGTAVLALAVRVSLATNAGVIETLRLMGARDTYIARAFVRRFTLRALAGAAAGTVLGAGLLLVLPEGTGAAVIGGLAPAGALGWGLIASVPLVLAVIAFTVCRDAAFRVLRGVR